MSIPIIDRTATGTRIRTIMQRQHISVKELQEYLGLACVQSIYHWLDGSSVPTVDNLYAMSELFQVPMDLLVCGSRRPALLAKICQQKPCQMVKTGREQMSGICHRANVYRARLLERKAA